MKPHIPTEETWKIIKKHSRSCPDYVIAEMLGISPACFSTHYGAKSRMVKAEAEAEMRGVAREAVIKTIENGDGHIAMKVIERFDKIDANRELRELERERLELDKQLLNNPQKFEVSFVDAPEHDEADL